MGSFSNMRLMVLVLSIVTLFAAADKDTFKGDCANIQTESELKFKFGETFNLSADFDITKTGSFTYEVTAINSGVLDIRMGAFTAPAGKKMPITVPSDTSYVCDFDQDLFLFSLTRLGSGPCATAHVVVKCTKDGSGKGEPHFQTFTGDRYDYHGECDLVLLHNPNYNQGMGIDIHIRTKIERFYSYIKTAVVRIGTETLEVAGAPQNQHWLNGELDAQLPTRMAEHAIGYRYISDYQRKFTIHLNDGGQIHITTYKQLVSVTVSNTTSDSFAGSEGLMGSYETGQKVARDKVTIIEDPNEFGQEWQVLPTDPMLFREMEGPQHPMKCLLPTTTAEQQRHLRAQAGEENVLSMDQARLACARVEPQDFDICVFDVMALNDADVAGAY